GVPKANRGDRGAGQHASNARRIVKVQRELQATSRRRRRARARRPPQAAIRPGRPAPTIGPGTCRKPMKLSGPSFDTRQPAGAPAGQPSWDDSPAKKPDEPDIARMVLNCACSAAVRPKSKTAAPLPCCNAKSAAVNVNGVSDDARLKLPTAVVPLKIVSTKLCIVMPVPPV